MQRTIPLDRIVPDTEKNARKTFHRIPKLADSIREYGLLQNLVVKEFPGREGYFLIRAGERRYRALCHLAKEKRLPDELHEGIPCVLIEDGQFENIVENVERESVAIWELGVRYYEWCELGGMTQVRIAAKIGKTQGHVSTAIIISQGLAPAIIQKLNRLPPDTFPVQRLMKLAALIDDNREPDQEAQLKLFEEMLNAPRRVRPKSGALRTEKQIVWSRFKQLKHGPVIERLEKKHREVAKAVLSYLSGETKTLEI